MDFFSNKKLMSGTDSVDRQIESLTKNTKKQLEKENYFLKNSLNNASNKSQYQLEDEDDFLKKTFSKDENKIKTTTRSFPNETKNITNTILPDKTKNITNTILPDEKKNITSKLVKNYTFFSVFSMVITTLRYVLLFYLIIYIILVILNQNNQLPLSIKNAFEPLDIINLLNKNNINFNKNEKNDNNKETKPLTSFEQNENQKESTPPTRLPQPGYPNPKPDVASSSSQSSKIAKKSGYCFIGEDRGFRSCVHVKKGDTCMSGDIFPNEAICINPKLRA